MTVISDKTYLFSVNLNLLIQIYEIACGFEYIVSKSDLYELKFSVTFVI